MGNGTLLVATAGQAVMRSADGGQTWHRLGLRQALASDAVIRSLCIAANPSNAQQLIAGTKYGHLFTSTNGGRGWQKHWRDFSEITDVAWSPEVAPIKVAHQSIAAKA